MPECTVVDGDAHYLEKLPDLAEYMDDDNPWKRRFKESPGKLLPSGGVPDHYLYGRIQRDEVGYLDGDMTPEDVGVAMDHVGVDKIIVISHKMLSFSRFKADDERAVLLANTYADYMLDEIIEPGKGIYALLIAPYQEPEKAAQLIDRVGDEEGFVGVCMISGGPEPPFGNRKYDPIFDAASRADLPLVFHAGGSSLDHFYLKGYEKFVESHTLGFLWNNMAQLVSVVIQGLPEKFPDLDFVFQESGVLYVPSLMARLDAEYLKRPSEVPILEQRPSKYMRDFFYGTQPMDHPDDPSYFERAIEEMGGASQLMYASDYPHWDYDPPSAITDISFFTETEKAAVLGGNAEEVFGI